MENLSEFVKACCIIGADMKLVNAGGGNISLKVNKKEMIIKSSGIDLSDVTDEKGYVTVDYPNIAEYLHTISNKDSFVDEEEKYNNILSESIIGNISFIPSIETGFHATMGKAVIHTHPLIVNAICCCLDGHKIIKEIFKDRVIWIPYKPPGIELSKEILNRTGNYNFDSGKPVKIFLENHGFIASGRSLSDCLKSTYETIEKINKYLQNKKIKIYGCEYFDDLEENNKIFKSKLLSIFLNEAGNAKFLENFIFPDAVVYCGCGFSLNKKDSSKITVYDNGSIELPENSSISQKRMIETIISTIYIFLILTQLGKPKMLDHSEVNTIKNMIGEKYRQTIK